MLALNVKLWLERSGRQKVRVDTTDTEAGHLGKQVRPTDGTSCPGGVFKDPCRRLTLNYFHRLRWVHCARHVSPAVNGLTVVTMTVELGDGLSA